MILAMKSTYDELEYVCQQLQRQLTQTYSQFGQEAGLQIVVLSAEYTKLD